MALFYCAPTHLGRHNSPFTLTKVRISRADIYFVFAGFHLAFSAYALIGIPSSGCAGIINTISRFADGSLVSAILCTIACVMWGLQGLGSLWMYKQVREVERVTRRLCLGWHEIDFFSAFFDCRYLPTRRARQVTRSRAPSMNFRCMASKHVSPASSGRVWCDICSVH